ncbi:MFS transporter [Rhizobacter sp. J219]|jgi:MFS family permease|uniref:MFS transporter n=1 Tax=Rhizobacter sp. J219 TaxID=2898430 RepID=UPI002151D014|nr:MFS transporter [Rhizobacter sp. J219]MCR5881562.1 MFS transporter [Rhizobacter sp. J219]
MLQAALNRLSLAGLSATLIGNGIGRFAFIALMPALIDAGWFTKGEASQLSVATLLGYVLGAWAADWLGRRYAVATLLRASMLICSVSFFACAFHDAPLAWYYVWRTAAGFCGAILMVLPAPVVLPQHDAAIRGRASGIVFSGIGLGAVLSGLLVPVLIAGVGVAVVWGGSIVPLAFRGVEGAWLGMGAICLALTVSAWRQWPPEASLPPAAADGGPAAKEEVPAESRLTVWLILAAHGLNAVGYLAHTMFWVDYIVREQGRSLAMGGFMWSMFGVGAAIGPLLTGSLADKFGLKRCLIAGFALKAVAAAMPWWSSSVPALFVSSILMGIFTPGIVALVSAYALETVGPALHRRAWGLATFSFSITQAGGGFLMATAAPHLDSYHPLFLASALALLGSIACVLLIRKPAMQEVAVAEPVATGDAVTPESTLYPNATALEK